MNESKILETYGPDLAERISGVGMKLYSRFDEISRNRYAVEMRWLKDLRQWRGVYGSNEVKDKFKSKTFVRLTRTKVKAVDARLMEMLFPANNEKNWDIKNTPNPDVVMTPLLQEMLQEKEQEMMEQLSAQAEESGQKVDFTGFQLPDEIVEAVKEEAAKKTCDNMRTEINDQLAVIKHRDICGRVVHDGNLYGTGILKAPLVQQRMHKKWERGEDGQWAMSEVERLLPYEEHVPIWDWYPDDNASEIDDCEIFFQFHRKSRHQLLDLATQPGFEDYADVIVEYARNIPSGDPHIRAFESEKSQTNDDNDTAKQSPDKRYALLECWAPLSGSDLMDLGFDEDRQKEEGVGLQGAWCTIWMLGPLVVNVSIKPLPGMDHPYHTYYYDKDETSIWGNGLAEILRDPQAGINSATRGTMDNMALTVGPQWDVNLDLLEPGENPKAIHPNRVWLRRGESRDPVVRAIQVESRTNEFLKIRDLFEQEAHENTVPSYMHGETDSGVGRTVGGLSMLMGAANINIKEQVRHFDDGITTPAIRGIYFWNMEFNEKDEIKGDFEVVAQGSSSLVAKELRVQHLDFALSSSNNPEDGAILDRRKLWEERMKAADLGGVEIVRSEEKYDRIKLLEQQSEQVGQENAMLKMVLQKANEVAPGVMRDVTGGVQSGAE